MCQALVASMIWWPAREARRDAPLTPARASTVTGPQPDVAKLPSDVTNLLQRHVESMEQAEVLLALTRQTTSIAADQIARDLQITPAAATAALEHFVSCGLATRDPARAGHYQYAPSSPALAQAVNALAVAYNTRPVTLIKAIYARPSSAIQSFADAFRLRKPGE